MVKILFICSANKDRSKTAEDHYSAIYPEMSFHSAGTNKKTCTMLGTNYMSQDQLDQTNHIYVMEQKHADAIRAVFGNLYFNKITVLHIRDVFTYGSKELIEILESKITFKVIA